MSIALETVAPGLAGRLEEMTPGQQRTCVVAGARMAAMRTALVDPRIEAATAAAEAGRYGESPQRQDLQELTEELDEAAWDIQERVHRGAAREEAYLTAFRKARASSAWWCALDESPLKAAIEGLYEAHHAINDPAALAALIDRVLRSGQPSSETNPQSTAPS